MKLYIAASSKESDRAERLAKIAEARGHSVTYAWFRGEHVKNPMAVSEMLLDDGAALFEALTDIGGIVQAHRFILLVPPPMIGTRGAYVELGVAHGVREFMTRPLSFPRLELVAAGLFSRATIFTRLCDAIVYADVDALQMPLVHGSWWTDLHKRQEAEDVAEETTTEYI